MTPQLNPVLLSEIRERTLKEVAKLPESIGRYRIRGELGAGGMGIVYDAFDPNLDRAVALKIIHRDKLGHSADRRDIAARFEKEMRATSDIFHPTIVSILDAGIQEGSEGPQPYYVMERVEGESLEELLQRSGRLSRSKAVEIAAAVARGLDAAHAKGLVHRDLKPSNILLGEDGVPRIADFGLCRLRTEVSSLTDAGTILGSANYISPEQLRGEEVTPASDLFSLGAILLRLVTGEEPFPAPSVAAHFHRILNDDPDGLDELDASLRALVTSLVAKDPTDRPESATLVAEQLEAMAGNASGGGVSHLGAAGGGGQGAARERGGTGNAGGGASQVREGSGANRLLIGVAVLAVLAIIVGAISANNTIVELDTVAATQWKQVENQLTRQNELIPQLVAVTKKYTEYETQTLERLARAGSRFAAEPNAETAAGVETEINGLLMIADRYPNLKADAHYRSLAYEIAGSKNRIAVERARYNEAVGALNARLDQLPWSLFAGSIGPREFFNPTPAQMAEPALDL